MFAVPSGDFQPVPIFHWLLRILIWRKLFCPTIEAVAKASESSLVTGEEVERALQSEEEDKEGKHTIQDGEDMKDSEVVNSASADEQEGPNIISEEVLSEAETKTNGSQGGISSELNETTEQSQDLRSSSSNFASLRAAFEHGNSNSAQSTTEGLKRRLTTNDSPGRRSSDKSREYEVEIGKLRDDLEKEKELRVEYEEKVTSLEEEVDDLTTQLEERDEMWRDEYTRSSVQAKKEAENRLNVITGEARAQREEASNLQKQLIELKRSVLNSSRTGGQVSDSTFKQEIGVLQHEIQNWIVNNFRRIKVDTSPGEICEKLEQVVNPKQLERLRPIYQDFETTAKLPILQATMACYVLEIFEDPYLFGLGEDLEWAKNIRDVAESFSSILEPPAYHRWRAVTFDFLRQTESMTKLAESSAEGIAETICTTLKSITEAEDNDARLGSLKPIIRRAISLAHMIRVQQAQYEVTLPVPHEAFEPTAMDDIADEADAETDRTVRCATFPSIVKIGDEDGDRFEQRNIVVKAKILCYEAES